MNAGPHELNRRLTVLVAHNRYQIAGGEDTAMQSEVDLLRAAGHRVVECVVSNTDIRSVPDKIRTALRVRDNPDGARRISHAIANARPDVLHVHNFFPLFSPSIYRSAREAGVAVVQTLHNYRTLCAGGLLMRDGKPCHKCLDGSPYWGTVHRCYRSSALASLPLSSMIAHHRTRGTWQTDVDCYLVLSEFARGIFGSAGFPADRMIVKPNTVDDPGEPDWADRAGIVYAGRLSQEKGVHHLIEAAHLTDMEISVIGDGPLGEELRAAAPPNVRFHGALPRSEVRGAIARARALVLPSVCYEGFPMTLAEAYAAGTPVIASDLGALRELVEDGGTGYRVEPADAAGLAAAMARFRDQETTTLLGQKARKAYTSRYAPDQNRAILEMAYRTAIARADRTVSA